MRCALLRKKILALPFRPLGVDYINWHNKLIYLYGEFMAAKAFLWCWKSGEEHKFPHAQLAAREAEINFYRRKKKARKIFQ